MKTFIIAITMAAITTLSGSARAEDMSHDMSHGMSTMAPAGDMGETNHSAHGAMPLRETVVDGYRFVYHLTDISETMAAMKAAGHTHGGMDATHHLMLYIESPDGSTLAGAQVGFLVTGESGAQQKHMGMEMSGGYGSDMNLGGRGETVIKTKVLAGELRLMDSFTFSDE